MVHATTSLTKRVRDLDQALRNEISRELRKRYSTLDPVVLISKNRQTRSTSLTICVCVSVTTGRDHTANPLRMLSWPSSKEYSTHFSEEFYYLSPGTGTLFELHFSARHTLTICSVKEHDDSGAKGLFFSKRTSSYEAFQRTWVLESRRY